MELADSYQRAKIYKLYIEGVEEVCYIGSTTLELNKRLDFHKNSVKYTSQKKTVASCLFEEGNEVVIALVEDYPCQSKNELELRERYWIEQFPECVNKNIPTRGWKERWLKNRDELIAKHKEWVKNNQEHIQEYKEKNKEKIKEQDKKRYDEGYKELRNAKKREKVKCTICEKEMNRNSINLHMKSVHKEPE